LRIIESIARLVAVHGLKFEETKSWLRKLIRRKVISELSVAEYKIIIDKLGPKLNAFINSTKALRPNF